MDPDPPTALIVAHGQPSEPGPAEAELAALGRRVAAHLPGWTLRTATLAAPGALEAALAGLPAPRVFPLFMADGWFTETHLPERLRAAGAVDPAMRVPFGLVPALQDLVLTRAREAAAEAGRTPGETAVLLAAHGSFRSPAPARVARAVAARLVAEAGFARAEAAFIDQEPRIADAARAMPEGALCLPFFAARGGHVIDDLPAALSEGGFRGSALPPIGLDPRVPALIAAAIAGG